MFDSFVIDCVNLLVCGGIAKDADFLLNAVNVNILSELVELKLLKHRY